MAWASLAPKGARLTSDTGRLRGPRLGALCRRLAQPRLVLLETRDAPLELAHCLNGEDGEVELRDRRDARLAVRRRGGPDLVAVAARGATRRGVEDHVDPAVVDEVHDGSLDSIHADRAGTFPDLPNPG